jgi:hypothetical protein
MRLYLVNASHPLVSSVSVNEGRWNRCRVQEPLDLLALGSLTPPGDSRCAASRAQERMNPGLFPDDGPHHRRAPSTP